MAGKEPEVHEPEQDITKFDKEIDQDIRRLKRSTNLLTFLGILGIILIIGVIGLKIYLDSLNSQTLGLSGYKDYVYIKNNNTPIYSGPGKNFEIVARMTRGEAIFLLREQGEWAEVEKRTIKGYVRKENIIHQADWPPFNSLEKMPIEFVDVDWFFDEIDNFTIIGKIQNTSEVPLKNIKIQVDFYDREVICCDDQGNPFKPVMTKETWVAQDKPLVAGVEQKFVIIGKYDKRFKKIKYRISSYE